MTHPPRRRAARAATTIVAVLAAAVPFAGQAFAAPRPATDPASLVNPLIGTSGAVDTFPGADAPFGMLQWSPDTSPHRTPGGGYEYNDSTLTGFSLTHISGPGCGALGDVPILPTVGGIGAKPGSATDTYSHLNEKADAGYYTVTQGAGVTTSLTARTRSGIGTFDFPRTSKANLLLKVAGSASTVDATSATVVSDHEVTGSVTSGHFCGQSTDLENDYTLHFDIQFDRPFAGYGTWDADGTTAGDATLRQHATKKAPATPTPPAAAAATGKAAKPFHGNAKPSVSSLHEAPTVHAKQPAAKTTGPGGVYLTFDASADQRVTAKVGISFTSDANAKKNLASEIHGWNFDKVRDQTHADWNALLNRIAISGGSAAQQQQFYTALYHVLLHPNVFSDVDGEYLGMDGTVHTAARGHAQYANYSGWDIYRSQVQLASIVAPRQTSDSIRSMLNDYDQSGMLPKWSLANGESYVMVGDPADAIIADAYAFGARDFDHRHALSAMVDEATNPSNIRPGQATLDQYGYLPYDLTYGCCNFYGPVSTQLEYDSADYAIAAYAKALGDDDTYTTFATRSQNWQHTFNAGSGYVQARQSNGEWVPGFSPGTGTGMVEGTAAQYTPMVPHNLNALILAKGGAAGYEKYLDSLFTSIDHPGPTNADLSNEPSIEIPWEYDYVGAPWKTQRVVREAQRTLYFDAPVGQFGNDDLGAMSSWYVFSELGMYPETPGTDVLALGSPVFPKAVVSLPSGRKLTISAPNASVENAYVNGLTLGGRSVDKPWLRYGDLANGGTLNYDLSAVANKAWGADPADAPPSDGTGQQATFTAVSPSDGTVIEPGGTGQLQVKVTNVSDQPISVSWTGKGDDGVSIAPTSGSLDVAARSTASAPVTVTAGQTEGRYTVSFDLKTADGTELDPASAHLAVAKKGELWPYYTNAGISDDGKPSSASLDTSGYAYSAQALAADGLKAGEPVTVNGISYTWPDAGSGELDNIEAAGQTIPLVAPSGAAKLGIIGSATNAGEDGAVGDLVVHYTDGSTQQLTLGFSDWTLGAGGFDPLPGDTTVASMPYRNSTSGGKENVGTYVFATSGDLTAGKTVASVTLPNPSATMHIFSIGLA
ncbi:lectin [Actinocatenispora sera]|uniref:lectin n=1 Tax=Actinocatenispora sera TaxID=390989 RepID=UPI0033F3E1CC